jgi:hypothetical protein
MSTGLTLIVCILDCLMISILQFDSSVKADLAN